MKPCDRALDEGDCCWTLGKGRKAKKFWVDSSEKGIRVRTGPQGKTCLCLEHLKINECIEHFRKRDWFPLGNKIDEVKENGLGEYFLENLKKSPKFASHFAAVLVKQRRFICRYGEHNRIELKVV